VTWAASGQVSATRFDLSLAYDGVGAPYEASVVGSIDADGRLRFGLGADGASPATRFGLRAVFVPEPAPGAAAVAAALALCWLSRAGPLRARSALTRSEWSRGSPPRSAWRPLANAGGMPEDPRFRPQEPRP
jgi:hypothetical protein